MSGKYKLNPFTGKLDRIISEDEFGEFVNIYSQLKTSVDTLNDLPLSGNAEGDMRVTLDTDNIYQWSIPSSSGLITDWKLLGSITSLAWGNLTGTLSNQTDLNSALSGKASTTHTPHAISEVTNLQTTLDDKADLIPQTGVGDTRILFPFDGSTEDLTGNYSSTLINGSAFSTSSPKKGTGYVNIVDSDAHIRIPYAQEFQIFDPSETRDFTLEFWAKQTSDLVGYLCSFGTDNANFWSIRRAPGDASLEVYSGGTKVLDINANPGVPVNGTWYHVGIIRVNGIYGLYYNGIQKGYYSGAFAKIFGGGSVMKIGTRPNDTSGWSGGIDDFRFSWGNVYSADPKVGLFDDISFNIDTSSIGASILFSTSLAYIFDPSEDLGAENTIWQERLEDSLNSNKGISLATDPSDPAEDKYTIWQSTGADSGNAGDIIIKINESTSTNIYKLLDVNLPVLGVIAENTDIDVGTEVVDSFSDTLTSSAVWFYRVKDGTNFRAGKIVAAWNENTDEITFNEISTLDIGDTSDLSFAVVINSNNVELQATLTSGSNYNVKVMRKTL